MFNSDATTGIVLLAIVIAPFLLTFLYMQYQKRMNKKWAARISAKKQTELKTILQGYANEIANSPNLSREEKWSQIYIRFRQVRSGIENVSLEANNQTILVQSVFGAIKIDFN